MSPINSFTAYEIECDKCGSNFEDDYIPWFKTEKDAQEHVELHDGHAWNGYVWCDNCTPPCSTCGCSILSHDHGEQPCEEGDGCEAFTYEKERA